MSSYTLTKEEVDNLSNIIKKDDVNLFKEAIKEINHKRQKNIDNINIDFNDYNLLSFIVRTKNSSTHCLKWLCSKNIRFDASLKTTWMLLSQPCKSFGRQIYISYRCGT